MISLIGAIHRWIYERSGGRIGRSLAGRPMLLLYTVGARSGVERVSPLLYVEHGDGVAVFASNNGGARNPGWLHNVRARPEAEVRVGRERYAVRAREAEGAERDEVWAKGNAVNKGQYDTYQSRTDRPIPVVVLERIR